MVLVKTKTTELGNLNYLLAAIVGQEVSNQLQEELIELWQDQLLTGIEPLRNTVAEQVAG